MLSRLWLKLVLYFRGIRFYEMTGTPRTAVFRCAEFRTIQGHSVIFSFYKESFRDLIYRRNKISEKFFTGYIIQAKFEAEDIPVGLLKYNCCKIFFHSDHIGIINEDELTSKLLSIYLDFILLESKTPFFKNSNIND